MGSQKNIITHVIFDVDNTLLDTEEAYFKGIQNICNKYGKEFSRELNEKYFGIGEDEFMQKVIDALDLPITVDEFMEDFKSQLEKTFSGVQLMPGAKRLVEHLHSHNIPLAVGTGTTRPSFDTKAIHHKDMFRLFHHVVCGADDPDVKHGKPAPDCYIVAVSRFDVKPEPEKVLVFEDVEVGVQSAVGAGLPCIWVPTHNIDSARKSNYKGCAVLDSLENFQPEMYGLPPFPR